MSRCIPLKTTSCFLLAHLQKSNEESRLISILPASVVSYLEKTLIRIGKENSSFKEGAGWPNNVQNKPHETKKVSKTKFDPTIMDLDAISQEIIERN